MTATQSLKILQELQAARRCLERIEVRLTSMLDPLCGPPPAAARTGRIKIVITAVCARYQIDEEMLFSSCRDQRFTWPRHVALALAHRMTSLSQSELGRIFGRDPTMINYAERAVADRCLHEPACRLDVEAIKAECAAACQREGLC